MLPEFTQSEFVHRMEKKKKSAKISINYVQKGTDSGDIKYAAPSGN